MQNATALFGIEVSQNREVSWDEFVEQYWKRQPGVFRAVGEPLFSMDGLFNAMLTAASVWHERDERFFSIWLDGNWTGETGAFLPVKEDGTIPYYVERILQKYETQDLTYTQSEIQRFAPDMWRSARAFVNPLVQRVGVSSDQVDIDTFVGEVSSDAKRGPYGSG